MAKEEKRRLITSKPEKNINKPNYIYNPKNKRKQNKSQSNFIRNRLSQSAKATL